MQNKDKSIVDLFNHLQIKFGEEEVLLKDNWNGDNFAIGIADKTQQYAIYISAYNKKENEFFVSLENLSTDNNFPYSPAGNFENVTISELEDILITHFKIKVRQNF